MTAHAACTGAHGELDGAWLQFQRMCSCRGQSTATTTASTMAVSRYGGRPTHARHRGSAALNLASTFAGVVLVFKRQGTSIQWAQSLMPPTSLGNDAVPVHPDGFGTALAAVAASTSAQGVSRPGLLAASAIDISAQAQQGAVYLFSIDASSQLPATLVATLTPPAEVSVRDLSEALGRGGAK